MPLTPDDLENAQACAGGIEIELRLPRGFIIGLLDESDWGFVIKLNAVFESLLNMAITRLLRAVHSEGLEEVVRRLDMADFRRGKIVIAAQLGLLTSEHKGFLRALAELRNQLAHSVENVGFSFPGWIALMNTNQRKAYATKFTCPEGLGQPESFEDDPKAFVFCGAVGLMEHIECSLPPAFLQDLRRKVTIDPNEVLSLLADSIKELGSEEGADER